MNNIHIYIYIDRNFGVGKVCPPRKKMTLRDLHPEKFTF